MSHSEEIKANSHTVYLEIYLDSEYNVLSLVFDDKNNLCDDVFNTIEKIEIIEKIIDFLNANYNYKYLPTHWQLETCRMKISKQKGELSFNLWR